MVKRAVLVACNYPSKAYGLAGCVNDAFAIAEQLEARGFENDNVLILHDTMPGRRRDPQKDDALRPTRVNILQRLQAMIRKTKAGDVCFFSFSGYGMQVDRMRLDAQAPEGLDEAILPTDFQDSVYNGPCVIECAELHDILASAPAGASVTMLMDCDHATSVADVSGTLSGKLIEGIRETDFCGVKAHAEKMKSSEHRRDVWMDDSARAVKARPRFQAAAQVCDPQSHFPTRNAMSRSAPIAFCISAAGHGQTALEMQVVTQEESWSTKEEKKQHGILSWCFVQALKELRGNYNYLELVSAISRQMASLKRGLPKLDQEALLTFVLPRSDPHMRVLEPPPQAAAGVRQTSSERQASVARPVVPPPPPGYVKGFPVSPPTSDLRPPSSMKKQLGVASPPSRKKSSSCCNAPGILSSSSQSPKSPRKPAQSGGGSLWESIMGWFNPAPAQVAPIAAVEPSASSSPLKPRTSPKISSSRPDEPPSPPQTMFPAPVPQVHMVTTMASPEKMTTPVRWPPVRAYPLPPPQVPQVFYPTLLLPQSRQGPQGAPLVSAQRAAAAR